MTTAIAIADIFARGTGPHDNQSRTGHIKKRTKLRFTDRARHDRAQQRIDTSAFADYSFVVELALDRVVHPIKGVLPVALKAQKQGKKALLVPEALNENEKAYGRST